MELINEIMVSLIVVVTFLSSGTQKHWRRISGTPNQFFLLPSLLLSVARKISTIASQTKHFLGGEMSYNYGNLKHTETMVIFIIGSTQPMKCQRSVL